MSVSEASGFISEVSSGLGSELKVKFLIPVSWWFSSAPSFPHLLQCLVRDWPKNQCVSETARDFTFLLPGVQKKALSLWFCSCLPAACCRQERALHPLPCTTPVIIIRLSETVTIQRPPFSNQVPISGRRAGAGLPACAKEINSRWMEDFKVISYSKERKRGRETLIWIWRLEHQLGVEFALEDIDRFPKVHEMLGTG